MPRSMWTAICGLAVSGLLFWGCTAAAPSATTTAAPAGNPSGSPAEPAGGSGSLRIYYGEAAQFEVVTPSGPVIFIDVWDTAKLANKPTAQDFLLTTHSHSDHLAPDFLESFPGKKITVEASSIKAGDVSIESIPALHDEGQELAQKDGPDYIFIIDVAGMRLAHFGDFGQDKVSPEQLAKLGKVDVAFSQLANPYSSMDESNKKGFNEMNQVSPKLLITTHISSATVEMAPKVWKAAWATGPITISKAKLPAAMTCLFMGEQAESYGKLYGIPAFGA